MFVQKLDLESVSVFGFISVLCCCCWLFSGQQHHEKRKQMQACCQGNRLRSTRQVEFSHFLIGIGTREPHLHAASAVFSESCVLVRIGPDLLTHTLSGGEYLWPEAALRTARTPVSAWERQTDENLFLPPTKNKNKWHVWEMNERWTFAPVPSLMPVLFTGVVVLTVLIPVVTVLQTQRHVQDSLLPPRLICLYDTNTTTTFSSDKMWSVLSFESWKIKSNVM